AGRLRHFQLRDIACKRCHRIGGESEISGPGEAAAAARCEIVVAVWDPRKSYSGRKVVAFSRRAAGARLRCPFRIRSFLTRNFGARSERVALALNDQGRTLQLSKVCGSQIVGLSRWVERIAEADEAIDCS